MIFAIAIGWSVRKAKARMKDKFLKDHPWYHETLSGDVSHEARLLLQEYSQIPPDRVDDHIYKIRDIAWKVAPYPCVGQFCFLSLNLYRHPKYDAVLQRVKDGAKLLDLGCCVGQDIRKLIADDAPSRNLYGSDLLQGYLDIGYQLFLDKSFCQATFFAADLFDDGSTLIDFQGQFDFVHAGLFLHLFDWDRQLDAVTRIISLLRPAPGSVFLGSQVGASIGGERPLRRESASGQNRKVFLHDPESFQRLWKEVETLTRTKWKVEVDAIAKKSKSGGDTQIEASGKADDGTFFGPDTTWLKFSVERL